MTRVLAALRAATQNLRRHPRFVLGAAATLALGLGAVTTLVSVLDLLLFRAPAGVEEPARVTRLYFKHHSDQFGDWTNSSVSYPDFTDLQPAAGFQGLAAVYTARASLGRGAEAAPVTLSATTGTYFRLLGTRPLLGRLLGVEDDRADAGAPVVVLSERLWRTRFGGDPGIVGRTLPLDDQVVTVVGVAPRAFDGGAYDAPDLWVPFTPYTRRMEGGGGYVTDRGWYFLNLVARLAPGATPEAAAAEATARIHAGRSDSISANGFQAVLLGPVLDAAGPDFGSSVELARWLAAMSFVVLLIACANVANLMLTRGLSRARELAIRKALGAGRGQLVRQLFLEGLLIAMLAGGLGLLLAAWGGDLLRGYLLSESLAERFRVDARVFGIAAAGTLLAAILSSLVPALQVTRRDLSTVLKEGARAGSFRRSRLRATLVVAQVALSVLLVTGAGLFSRSLQRLLAVNIGYDRSRILMVRADPASAGFTGTATGQAFDAMAQAARAHPGVESVALSFGEPFGWSLVDRVRIAGRDSLPRFSSGGPYILRTTGDFFRTMGLEVQRGRLFTDADRRAHPAVAVIGATMARRYFEQQDPIGQCLLLGADRPGCTEIVGVVEDGIRYSPQEEPQAQYYVPLPPADSTTHHLAMFVRTRGPAERLAADLRGRLQLAVPNLPYVEVRSLNEVLEPRYHSARLGATLFGLYAAVALVLAGLGLYSVLAYAVRGRTHELGIRVALGAEPRVLLGLVVGDGVRLAAGGALLGLTGALAGGRLLASQLYGVAAWDPPTLGAALGTVLLAALLASVPPARRAARVDPMTALRSD